MTTAVVVEDDLAGLPGPARALLDASPHLYASPPWLAVEQQSHPGRSAYVHATAGGDATAVAAVHGFDGSSNPWPAARLDLFLRDQAGADDVAGQAVLPCWLLGGRRPGHSRVLTDGPPEVRRELLHRLVGGAAEAAARSGAASLAALYCDRDDRDLEAAFTAHGATRFPAPGLNRLELPEGGWDGWLAGLSKKRRYAELADARKLAEAGVELTCRPLSDRDVDEVLPLELALYDRYGHDYRHSEARSLHFAYLRHLGDDALVVRAVRQGHLLGFASLVRSGSTVHVRQAGFDTAACEGVPVYFGTVFHEPIRWAVTAGVRILDLSTSMDDMKRRRGATTFPRDAWVLPLTQDARAAVVRMSSEATEPAAQPPGPPGPPGRSWPPGPPGFMRRRAPVGR